MVGHACMPSIKLNMHDAPDAVRCPDLQSPGNGFIAITAGSYSQFGLGAVANYSCNPGFTLVGRMIRGCRLLSGGEESTGVWSTTKPSCRGKHAYIYTAIIMIGCQTIALMCIYNIANGIRITSV